MVCIRSQDRPVVEAKIRDLWRQGLNRQQIAARTNMSMRTIIKYCKYLNLPPHYGGNGENMNDFKAGRLMSEEDENKLYAGRKYEDVERNKLDKMQVRPIFMDVCRWT